ncbi:MAG: hypothetical protein QF886_05580, partial [Planctomycetota bacterium]|nr:hypothetical protein [Planctomycetota bacterium]
MSGLKILLVFSTPADRSFDSRSGALRNRRSSASHWRARYSETHRGNNNGRCKSVRKQLAHSISWSKSLGGDGTLA